MRVLQCRSKPRDVQLGQLLAHKRMLHQPANRALNGVVDTQEEWDWVDVTALKKNSSGDVLVRVDWGPEWSDEKGSHETWEPIECLPASEEVFIDLVKEKMEEDPDFFDEQHVKVQFLEVGLDICVFGEVELLPWLIEKKKLFLDTLSDEDREYKQAVDDARKRERQVRQTAREDKKRLSVASKARKTKETIKKIASKRVTEKRKARETGKKVELARKTVKTNARAARKMKAEERKTKKMEAAKKQSDNALEKEKKKQEVAAKKAERAKAAATKTKRAQVLTPAPVLSPSPQAYQPAPAQPPACLYQPITPPPMAHSPPSCLFDQSLPQYPQAIQTFHQNHYPPGNQFFPTLDYPFASPSVTPDVFDPPF